MRMSRRIKNKVLLDQEESSFKRKETIRETGEALLIALVLALFIRQFSVQAFKIPSGSMKQTLLIGDHILVNKFRYGIKIPFTDSFLLHWAHPKRGDIIVFRFPNNHSVDFIKRVIGVPGDKIEVRDKRLYVNDEPVTEDFTQNADPRSKGMNPSDKRDFFGPITVSPGHYFMMGDNRDNSQDSRYWGELPENLIHGSAFLVYLSWDSTIHRNWGILENIPGFSRLQGGIRWGRIGRIIQ